MPHPDTTPTPHAAKLDAGGFVPCLRTIQRNPVIGHAWMVGNPQPTEAAALRVAAEAAARMLAQQRQA